MTVSTEIDHNEYTGNGTTTVFPYQFRIFKSSDLVVQTLDTNENIKTLMLDTDYCVQGAGGYNGGSITLPVPLPDGWKITITRELPVTQETDLRNQGSFFPEVHEDAFDKLTMLIQRCFSVFGLALRKPNYLAQFYDALNNRIRNLRDPAQPQDAATKSYVDSLANTNLSRTLRVPESIPTLPDAAARSNKIAAFDSQGNPIVVLPPSGSASDVLIEIAKPSGSLLVGYGESVVEETLTKTFEYFGAVGDGEVNDTAAIQAAAVWVTAGNYRQLTTEEGKIYRVSATVDFNFGNGRGHCIDMKSPIRPDDGTGTAFLLQNTRDAKFNLKVDGGGHNSNYHDAASSEFVDYRTADPAGAQHAFYFRGIRNSDLNITGTGYSGRVLRINALDTSSGGVIKTSFITLRIKTGDQGAGEMTRCGQAYYLQGDDNAWGKIERAWLNWDRFGSIHYKLADITIGNIEAGFAGNGGLQFYGVATAHIGTLSVGDETFTNTNILFANSDDGRECIAVHIDRVFASAGNIGLELRGSNGNGGGNRPNFDINNIYIYACKESNVILNGINNSIIRNIHSQGGKVPLRLQRIIRNSHVTLNSSSETDSSILADPDANINNLYIKGRSFGNFSAPTVDLSAATGGMRIVFDGYTIRAGFAAYAIPVANNISIINGEIDTSAGGKAFSLALPKVCINNVGFTTRNRGAGSIAAGNQTVTITHGLAQQPTEIGITPLSTATGYRISNLTATTFDLRLATPLGESDPAYTFNWVASCEYH